MEATMLGARKLARILANRERVRQGRTTTVTLVYNKPEGTIYQPANVVWQDQHYADPIAQAPAAAGTPSAIHPPQTATRSAATATHSSSWRCGPSRITGRGCAPAGGRTWSHPTRGFSGLLTAF